MDPQKTIWFGRRAAWVSRLVVGPYMTAKHVGIVLA